MERQNLDLVSIDKPATTTRRGLLRTAAALAGVAALGAIGDDADAARRMKAGNAKAGKRSGAPTAKRTTGRKARRGTCRPGKGMGRIEIPANGNAVKTPVLAKGRTYRLRASGYVGLENGDGTPALGLPAVDADYGFFRQGAPRPNDRVGNLDWGVAIDGKVPAWGAFDEHHDYTIVVAGRGKPLALELVYATDEFAPDGEGRLVVEIECA